MAKRKGLTSKQEAFAQHYVIHKSPIEAFRAAGYSETYANPNDAHSAAQRVLNNAQVKARIEKLAAKVEEKLTESLNISRERIIEMHLEERELAMKTMNPSSATGATKAIAGMHGFDRPEGEAAGGHVQPITIIQIGDGYQDKRPMMIDVTPKS